MYAKVYGDCNLMFRYIQSRAPVPYGSNAGWCRMMLWGLGGMKGGYADVRI